MPWSLAVGFTVFMIYNILLVNRAEQLYMAFFSRENSARLGGFVGEFLPIILAFCFWVAGW